jgi:hypothetical protein
MMWGMTELPSSKGDLFSQRKVRWLGNSVGRHSEAPRFHQRGEESRVRERPVLSRQLFQNLFPQLLRLAEKFLIFDEHAV